MLLLSVVTLTLLDVDVEGLDGDSGGAVGWPPYVASLAVAPHPAVVEAVAVDAKEFVDECLESALGVSFMLRMVFMYLFAIVGLEEHKSSSKQILHVAVGIVVYHFCILQSRFIL